MEVFFYINICGFIDRGKFLYETRVLDSSYLQYKVQLPTSDSIEITAGGIKVRRCAIWCTNAQISDYAKFIAIYGRKVSMKARNKL